MIKLQVSAFNLNFVKHKKERKKEKTLKTNFKNAGVGLHKGWSWCSQPQADLHNCPGWFVHVVIVINIIVSVIIVSVIIVSVITVTVIILRVIIVIKSIFSIACLCGNHSELFLVAQFMLTADRPLCLYGNHSVYAHCRYTLLLPNWPIQNAKQYEQLIRP